jgi:alkaline phosphatase
MRLLSISLLLSTLLLSFPGHAQNPADASPDDAPLPRHVILIIGDGMDEQQITIARNYLQGATGRLLLDEMPLRGASQILTIEDKEDGKPVYVADSANTATSMATGQVTSRGRIATSAGSDKPIETIVELAEAAGYRTGIVSTASVTDATMRLFTSQDPGSSTWAVVHNTRRHAAAWVRFPSNLQTLACMSFSAAARNTSNP